LTACIALHYTALKSRWYIEGGDVMQSQLTVRLSDELDREIAAVARQMHLKRADVVRMALQKFLDETKRGESSPYEKVQGLIGSLQSGITNLGEGHREHLLRKFRKHA
jgi:Arc/MetJ-type ribon-helix-helix transcriptional regulator